MSKATESAFEQNASMKEKKIRSLTENQMKWKSTLQKLERNKL